MDWLKNDLNDIGMTGMKEMNNQAIQVWVRGNWNESGMIEWHPNDGILSEWTGTDKMIFKWWNDIRMINYCQN